MHMIYHLETNFSYECNLICFMKPGGVYIQQPGSFPGFLHGFVMHGFYLFIANVDFLIFYSKLDE